MVILNLSWHKIMMKITKLEMTSLRFKDSSGTSLSFSAATHKNTLFFANVT